MSTPGRIEQRALADDPDLTYFLYAPTRAVAGAPLFVSVHGASRQAAQHAELFAPHAERRGAVLVAPLFTRERFPDYHCLGRQGHGDRSDLAVQKIIAEVGGLTGARSDRFYLFGYSGGGQFAHRYMMAYPEQVVRVGMGAPGWYTFPASSVDYPFGIGSAAGLPGVAFKPARFLRVPCLVVVGEQDIVRDHQLNQEPQVDVQQGRNRLERARRWVAAMRAAAVSRGLDDAYGFHVLPGVGHSFAECMNGSDMGTRVFEYLFARQT